MNVTYVKGSSITEIECISKDYKYRAGMLSIMLIPKLFMKTVTKVLESLSLQLTRRLIRLHKVSGRDFKRFELQT